MAEEEGNRTEPSVLGDVQRFLDLAENTEHDAEADVIAEGSEFAVAQVGAEDEEQEYRMPCPGPISPDHLIMHLPRLKGCAVAGGWGCCGRWCGYVQGDVCGGTGECAGLGWWCMVAMTMAAAQWRRRRRNSCGRGRRR